jgi:hypothetical protein
VYSRFGILPLFLGILLLAAPASNLAQGTFVSAPTRRAMVFDHAGKFLYFTGSDGYVRRYNVVANQVDLSYNLGGFLNGLDIAPDDSYLLVAQYGVNGPIGFVQKIDLASGTISNLTFTRTDGEAGTWDVAIAGNGLAFFTTLYGGSGWTPLRQINLKTGDVQIRIDAPGSGPSGSISTPAQLNRSADGSRLYILEGNISSGPLFSYSAVNDTFSQSVLTSNFLSDQYGAAAAAVSRDGTQLITRISDHASLDAGSDFTFLHDFNGVDCGVAFNGSSDTVYGVNSSLHEIIAYDSKIFTPKSVFSFPETFNPGFLAHFDSGTLVASPDGRFLALEVPNGFRIFATASGMPPSIPQPTLATRRDIVFDNAGHYAYISTATGYIERYDLTNGTLELIADLGGSLYGLDISADNTFLLVAQGNTGVAQGMFQRLDLQTRAVKNITYAHVPSETGAWGVAITPSGSAIGTTIFYGSGWVPVRQIDPATGISQIRKDVPGSNGSAVTGRTNLQRSADRSRFHFWESDISSGPVFTYDATHDVFGPSLNTGAFAESGSAAVSRDGSLLATRIGSHATIDSAPDYRFVRAFNYIDGGVAFDATADRLYAVNTVGNAIIAYDTNQFHEQFRIAIDDVVASNYAGTFDRGILTASPDGNHLALSTASGVHFYNLPGTVPAAVPSLSDARDLVFDHAGNYVYIATASGFVFPWNLHTRQVEAPYELGGSLNGIDISPDDAVLVVAQGIGGLAEGAFHKINLATKTVTDITYTYINELRDDTPWDVAIAANGRALMTTGYRVDELDLSTNGLTDRTDLPAAIFPQTSISRSADRNVLCFIDSSSDGRLFLYHADAQTFGPSFLTNSYNVGGAVNHDGSLLARRSDSSAYLHSLPSFSALQTLSGFDSGLTFNPVNGTLYSIHTLSDQIVAYAAPNFSEQFRLPLSEHIPSLPIYSPSRFGAGVLQASRDGHFLAVIEPTSVQLFDLTAPPPPPPPALAVVSISSSGTVVEGGTATFQISATPNTPRPLTVYYTLSGSAIPGYDYSLIGDAGGSAATFQPGQNSLTVAMYVWPDGVKEKKETIAMTLSPGPGYSFGAGTKKKKAKPPSATVTIAASR